MVERYGVWWSDMVYGGAIWYTKRTIKPRDDAIYAGETRELCVLSIGEVV